MKTKLKLNELEIKSFNTNIDDNNQKTIHGMADVLDAEAATKIICLLKKILPPPVCTLYPLKWKTCFGGK